MVVLLLLLTICIYDVAVVCVYTVNGHLSRIGIFFIHEFSIGFSVRTSWNCFFSVLSQFTRPKMFLCVRETKKKKCFLFHPGLSTSISSLCFLFLFFCCTLPLALQFSLLFFFFCLNWIFTRTRIYHCKDTAQEILYLW